MNFNDLNWHDSIIKSIYIDRSNPGIKDEIRFEIEWVDRKICTLLFENVYWASMNLNFGIVVEESILDAKVLDKTDVDLINFHSKWNGLMDDLNLTVFLIELNSTGSIIKIIADGYKID